MSGSNTHCIRPYVSRSSRKAVLLGSPCSARLTLKSPRIRGSIYPLCRWDTQSINSPRKVNIDKFWRAINDGNYWPTSQFQDKVFRCQTPSSIHLSDFEDLNFLLMFRHFILNFVLLSSTTKYLGFLRFRRNCLMYVRSIFKNFELF